MGSGCIRFHPFGGSFYAVFVLLSETGARCCPTRKVRAKEGVGVNLADFFKIDFLSVIDAVGGKS